MRRRAQRTPFMHAAETCCTHAHAAARSRMAEGSSVAGSLHAVNDNPAGDDGGSNEAGNARLWIDFALQRSWTLRENVRSPRILPRESALAAEELQPIPKE